MGTGADMIPWMIDAGVADVYDEDGGDDGNIIDQIYSPESPQKI